MSHHGTNMHFVDEYEWGTVYADPRDPDAGGASNSYVVYLGDNAPKTEIQFQHGPRHVATSVRGVLDDHLLAILKDRLVAFQAGPFPSDANEEALRHVQSAQAALRRRAEERRQRGVLGRNEV